MRKFLFRLITIIIQSLFLLMSSGCIVIEGTSKVWRVDDQPHTVPGPGEGEVTFLVREMNRYKVDDGSRLSIGITPGVPKLAKENGSLGFAIYIGCTAYPLINCIFLGIPTMESLFFAPFNPESETFKFLSELGLIGCCEWDEQKMADELIERGAHEDIVEITGCPAPEGTKIAGETHDGIRFLFAYPGNSIMLAELKQHEKVAVAFRANYHKYRIFLPAKHFESAYTFKDVDIADDSVEMNQIRYFNKAQNVKVAVTPLFAHKILGGKANAIDNAIDNLLTALPHMDTVTLAERDNEVHTLIHQAHEIAKEEKATAACRAESMALRKQVDNLQQRKFYGLVSDEDFRTKVLVLANKLDEWISKPSPDRLKKIDGLRTETNKLESEFEKLLVCRAERIRAMEEHFKRLQSTIIKVRDEKSKCTARFKSKERKIRKDHEGDLAKLGRAVNEKKLSVSTCHQQIRSYESDILWAQQHTKAALTARAALEKDSLFARVSQKAEGVEIVFDEIWKTFYDEDVRRTMYSATMDCRSDGTPNVIVGIDERSLDISIRVSRNETIHDDWKLAVRDKFNSIGLSSQLSPFEDGSGHHVAGRYYRLGENEQAAFERWRNHFGTQFQAELFVEVSLLSADGTTLLSQRQPYKPKSTYEDDEWSDEEIHFSFSSNVDAKLLDAVKNVDVNILDGVEIVRRAEKLLQLAKTALNIAEKNYEKARAELEAEQHAIDAQIDAVRKERKDAEQKCQEKIEKAEAEMKDAKARTEDEWRKILKSEGVK